MNALTSSISSAARSSELGRLLDDRLDWRPSRPEPGSGDGDALRDDPREPPTPEEKKKEKRVTTLEGECEVVPSPKCLCNHP